ncbi:hypothetical protein NA57DRAFT_50929 [Rhizodiscina lignyota]|uniref:Uncharacterized protein n=1 Tax=Rhizodiscina lignyota TaxID=1504668 RepID=A0A9P4MAK1_9PEZI|nr:hypothetical protein NA57DRAFT_50929 [Rhizodiscina lignyota]
MAEPATEGHQQSSSVDIPASQLAPILRAILQHNDQIVEQNQAILQLLNYHVRSLPNSNGRSATGAIQSHSHTGTSTSPAPVSPRSSGSVTQVQSTQGDRRHEHHRQSMWDGILTVESKLSGSFVKDYHEWKRPPAIRDVFLGKNEWTSKSYHYAFPDLVDFLKRNDLVKKCHSQVSVRDFVSSSGGPTSSAYNEARPRVGVIRGKSMPVKSAGGHRTIRSVNAEDPFGCKILWDALDGCPCHNPGQTAPVQSDSEPCLCMRSINILDVSPKVLNCLLASTPRVDLSYMAAFVQRHLGSSNWGKATPLRYGDTMSSYTLEYHFSFYYVTPKYFDTGSVRPDLRNQRKSAAFGNELATRSRYIHEESLSFLYIGHFKDVSTSVQLAESYFKYDPYHTTDVGSSESSLFRPLNPNEPPAMLMLSWISVALHHVLWRWQSAIDAVQAEIKSSRQIVFMDDRNDLMADDPQFTLSKTYFWALQAYKLFEETISETVTTWRRFQDESLPVLRDNRVPSEEWKKAVQDINDAVSELESKTRAIRKRAEEVRDLRKGLISASALFDSRISVRQGENIRLLTYITLLFLPLSFATSIFGMQIIGNSTSTVHIFAAVLPAITVVTALFVFNLHNVVNAWELFTDYISSWLRSSMKEHRRGDWQRTAIALHEDMNASKAPVRKAQKRSSAWVYLVFIIEALIVSLPVGELSNAASLFRRMASSEAAAAPEGPEDGDDIRSIDPHVFEKINESLAEERKRQRQKRREKIGPVLLALEDIWHALPATFRWIGTGTIDIIRALLLPLWVIVVMFEYLILSLILLIASVFRSRPDDESVRSLSNTQKRSKEPSCFRRAFLILGLDTVFPARPKAIRPSSTESSARRNFSQAATQMTLRPEKSSNQHETTVVAAASPPPAERPPLPPLIPRSPISPNFNNRPDTLISDLSYSNDHSRDTIDFIEQMSRAGTRPSTPRTPAAVPSEVPQSPRPGTRHTAHTARTVDTAATDASLSRPGTAHTDVISPLPEMIARAEPLKRMSARPVASLAESSTAQRDFAQRDLRISAMGQKPKTVAAEKQSQRKSHIPVVEVLELDRPPTPPPK